MTEQIDELMQEIDQVLDINTTTEWDALRKLLEAALKPKKQTRVGPKPMSTQVSRLLASADKMNDHTQHWTEYVQAREDFIGELEAALKPGETVAEVVWSKDTDYEYKFEMLVELACKEGVPVKLYAGPFESGRLYWHDTEKDAPATPPAQTPPPRLTISEIADAHPRLYGIDEDNLDFARAIETAVRRQFGVSDE